MATHLAMQQSDQSQGWSSLSSWGAPPLSCGGGNTWSKRSSAMANDDDSWEVRAFAEDASRSGQWPPRSYACSFCKRGFRTAQALGGHMNVHRRERQEADKLRSAEAAAAAAENHRLVAVVPSSRDWALASLSHLLGGQPTSRTTVELLSPLSPQPLSLSLSTSGSSMSSAMPSPESISSSSGIPADFLCESLHQRRASWGSERGLHPYERSGLVNLARFSIVPKDKTPDMDLELRLGRSNSGDR